MKIDEVQRLHNMLAEEGAQNPESIARFLRRMGMDPDNIYQEMEMSSRYVNTHRDTSSASARVSLHSHSYYEFLYCRSVPGVEYLIGSDRYSLQTGDIIFVPPGISHRPILPDNMAGPYVRDVIWVSHEFMTSLERMFPDNPGLDDYPRVPFRTADTPWASIAELFDNGVREAQQQKPGWETAVIGNTLLIFAQLKRAFAERSLRTLKIEKRELLDDLTAHIEANYASHLTLQELAKQFYVSESTVSHLFKQRMGVSVYRYITQRRLIEAKNRILEGVALDRVAEQVGFADYSSFYRAFKGEFGISPRQFRNQSARE